MPTIDKPLVDWNKIVVRTPEEQANETTDILKAISPAQRCEMRKNGFDFYQHYMKDGNAVAVLLTRSKDVSTTV
jgi:hypothetical protein